VALETVRIIEELIEIWPNEVCDSKYHNLAKQLSHFLFFFCFVLFYLDYY